MTPPPAFGRAVRRCFFLEEGMTFLNHGSFGATPRSILQAQNEWRVFFERQPLRFVIDTLPGALREAAANLAAFVGAEGEDLVFVDNATSGANSVLRSFPFEPGDEILCTDHSYGAVLRTLEYVCDRTGAQLKTVSVPYPIDSPEQVVEAVEGGFSPRTRMAVLDHITSATGLIFPIQDLVALCRARGVPVLVDGAHGPGMVALDLPAMGADWYTGNCHKWMCSPKGCAFLWANPQSDVARKDLHPPVISHFLGQGLCPEFDFVGTRDYSAFLAIGATLEFLRGLGAERIRQHNHELALEGTRHVAGRLGAELTAPPSMVGSMASFPWVGPRDQELETTPEGALLLRSMLWDEHRTEVSVTAFGDRFWVRLCAHVYNEMADYEGLADALAGRLS